MPEEPYIGRKGWVGAWDRFADYFTDDAFRKRDVETYAIQEKEKLRQERLAKEREGTRRFEEQLGISQRRLELAEEAAAAGRMEEFAGRVSQAEFESAVALVPSLGTPPARRPGCQKNPGRRRSECPHFKLWYCAYGCSDC